DRAGASTSRAAACVPMRRCARVDQIFSFITARAHSRSAFQSCIPRIYANARNADRARPGLPQDFVWPLLDIFMLDMRSYRGPNGEDKQEIYGPDAYFLGPTQVAWLKRELLSSQATWKVIAADMPLSLVVVYDVDRKCALLRSEQGGVPGF